MTKRERVEATLNCKPVDRVAVLEQLSYNPAVIAQYTGKEINGFDYTLDDICHVIGQTLDICMPPVPPRGTERITTPDGFVIQQDNWTSWIVKRPFDSAQGARDWLLQKTADLKDRAIHPEEIRKAYQDRIRGLTEKSGGTVIMASSHTGFCGVYDRMGLESFSFFIMDYLEIFDEFMKQNMKHELARVHAVADRELSPVILIAEDFATKQGQIFSNDLLFACHYPHIKTLTDAWHEHDIKVIFHSDGNWKKCIPDLLDCGVDGFYCLEPNCGMDIVELKNTWPQVTWAGGVDGVDLMERGAPEEVTQTVQRHIHETNAQQTGGMFVASSSEINPPIPVENFTAMMDTAHSVTNTMTHLNHFHF